MILIEVDNGRFAFVADQGNVEVMVSLSQESGIDDVVAAFRGFLVAIGFSVENIDQYLTPE